MSTLRRKRRFNILLLAALGMGALTLTACSSADIPSLYDYDDLSEFIELGEYKNLEYEAISTEVTSAEVMDEINAQLQENTSTKALDSGTVTGDSVVNIDYYGELDGKAVDGAKAEGVIIDMSNNNYVDGFAEGLLGHKVGDKFDMNVTFPDDYVPELAGKTVVFTISINSLQVTEIPEYTDDFVKKHTDYKSKSDYEKAIRKELEASKKSDADSNHKLEIFNKILDSSKVIKYPEKEYQNRYDNIISTYTKIADDNDIDFKTYLSSQLGISEDDFYAQAKASAESAVKQELVLYQIARLEGVSISKKEYNEYLEKQLEDSGYTKSSFKEKNGMSIEEYAEKNSLYTSLLYDKVMDKVMKYSISR